MLTPHLIQLPKIGGYGLGYLSLAQRESLPFIPKRIYWVYHTPEDIQRGSHAHYELEQIVVAVSGTVAVKTETITGEVMEFELDKPDKGLFIPKLCWRGMKYSHNAVLLCIASLEYSETDYIRDYQTFKKMKR